jgi:hypothetical protein
MSALDTRTGRNPSGVVRVLAILVMLGGLVLLLGGIATWAVVQNSLAAEKITVSQDATRFAGDAVNGPLTAFAQADTIKRHSLEASGGKTYAELDSKDPRRAVVMTGSFLRASLFTSVVSFGVAAMAAGLGLLNLLIGFCLLRLARTLSLVTS